MHILNTDLLSLSVVLNLKVAFNGLCGSVSLSIISHKKNFLCDYLASELTLYLGSNYLFI